MKKVFVGLVLSVSFVIEMFVGAVQLGLFSSQNAQVVSFISAVIFGSIMIFTSTTWISDILVLKFFKYDVRHGRWHYYSCGDYHFSPGVSARLVAHALSQAFPIYFAAIYVFK
jgi:hypothetical protein